MKFVHIADMHFDTTFDSLKENQGEKRRLEQREAFSKMIEYIKENKIPYLFISGDLYEQKYIRESTIEFINNKFKEISETMIFIAPGNHDPFLKNSYYNNYNWSKNVIIFNNKIEKISLEEVDIYGYGFTDFYCTNSKVDEIEIKNKEKINILITHGSLDASKTLDMQYNPINSVKLRKTEFDYVALGHIHKANYNKENKFIYPGSLISFGFDELGEHGILDVEINKNNAEIKFEKIDSRIFEEKEIDISLINSEEELIEKINDIDFEENKFYKIILTGIKKIEINNIKIIKLINNKNILKIKNNTKIEYNLEKISEQKNLKGIFVKKLLEKIKNNPDEEKIIKRSIEIGLKMFE